MNNKRFSLAIILVVAAIVALAVVLLYSQGKPTLPQSQQLQPKPAKSKSLQGIQKRLDSIDLGNIDSQFNSVDKDIKKLD